MRMSGNKAKSDGNRRSPHSHISIGKRRFGSVRKSGNVEKRTIISILPNPEVELVHNNLMLSRRALEKVANEAEEEEENLEALSTQYGNQAKNFTLLAVTEEEPLKTVLGKYANILANVAPQVDEMRQTTHKRFTTPINDFTTTEVEIGNVLKTKYDAAFQKNQFGASEQERKDFQALEGETLELLKQIRNKKKQKLLVAFSVYIEQQINYHSTLLEVLAEIQPVLDDALKHSHTPNRRQHAKRQIFGVELSVLIGYQQGVKTKANLTPRVPRIVECICEHIEQMGGLEEVGIFRKGGVQRQLGQIKREVNTGGDVDRIVADGNYSVHTLAELLRIFLRELPATIVPDKWIPRMNCAQSVTHKIRAEYLQTILVNEIDKPEFWLIGYLCKFLKKIVANCKVNKMTLDNIATVVGPNLFDSPDYISGNAVIKMLIEECDSIFTGKYDKVAPSYDTISKFPCKATNPKQELSLSKGENVYVFGRWDDDWVLGEAHGRIGLVPEAYLKPKTAKKSINSS